MSVRQYSRRCTLKHCVSCLYTTFRRNLHDSAVTTQVGFILPLPKDMDPAVSASGDTYIGWASVVVLMALSGFLFFIWGSAVTLNVIFLFIPLPASEKTVADGVLTSLLLALPVEICQQGFALQTSANNMCNRR